MLSCPAPPVSSFPAAALTSARMDFSDPVVSSLSLTRDSSFTYDLVFSSPRHVTSCCPFSASGRLDSLVPPLFYIMRHLSSSNCFYHPFFPAIFFIILCLTFFSYSNPPAQHTTDTRHDPNTFCTPLKPPFPAYSPPTLPYCLILSPPLCSTRAQHPDISSAPFLPPPPFLPPRFIKHRLINRTNPSDFLAQKVYFQAPRSQFRPLSFTSPSICTPIRDCCDSPLSLVVSYPLLMLTNPRGGASPHITCFLRDRPPSSSCLSRHSRLPTRSSPAPIPTARFYFVIPPSPLNWPHPATQDIHPEILFCPQTLFPHLKTPIRVFVTGPFVLRR